MGETGRSGADGEEQGVFVKICGLKTVEDVAVAVEAGADAIGVVLSSTSVRALSIDQAHEIVDSAAGAVTSVLVIHDVAIEAGIDAARSLGADVLQLHDYSEADTRAAAAALPRVWRATSVARGSTVVGAHGEEALLLDSQTPGSGARWDLSQLDAPPQGRGILAGGLAPANVADAIATARPWGVDVSSGVESTRGVKDHGLIRDFVAAVRGAQARVR